MEKQQPPTTKPTHDSFKPEREQRGEQRPSPAADQLGATEQQVQPLTPPSAKSDQQPDQPKRKQQPDLGIDPTDDLTPG